MNKKDIRKEAKDIVKRNKWYLLRPLLLMANIIFFFILFVSILSLSIGKNGYIYIIGFLFLLLILLYPLYVGYKFYVLEFTDGDKFNISYLIKRFYKYYEVILMSLFFSIIVYLSTSLLLLIPGFIVLINYSCVPYILGRESDTESSAIKILKKSKNIIKGYRKDYLLFVISFIPNFLLCILSLGIYLIWFVPYYQVCLALYYKNLKIIYDNENN